jgi:hypothetical protein
MLPFTSRHSLLALAICALTVAGADAQTTLRLKYKKGDVNAYEMTQSMKMAQNVQGMDIDTTIKQTMELETKVEDVLDNGNAKVVTKFKRVRMELEAPAPVGKVVLDSKDDQLPDNPVAKIMGGMIKTLAKVEFAATMTPRGETVDFKLPAELIQEFRNMPGGAQLGDMFSEEGLKNMMSQSGIILPEAPVQKGATWTQKVNTKLPFGKMAAEMKYTYQGTETVGGKTLQKITFIPDAKIDADPAAPVSVKVESQKGSGTILFDNDAGRLQETTLQQVMEMTVGVMNLNIAQKLDQTVSMKLKTK